MLAINMKDVMSILSECMPYFVFLGIVLAAAIVVSIAVRKQPRPKKKFIRKVSFAAVVAALAIAVSLIAWGPMANLLTLATSGKTTVSTSTTEEAKQTATNIADEGIVMLKNDDSSLPLAGDKKVNVFGWASTNPVYGGTGSGGMNEEYPTVSLLQGLSDAGISTNTELSDFYTSYLSARPKATGGMFAIDWSLPEPSASSYSSDLVSSAKSFSNKAVIVIARAGGEGSDLPTDMSTVTASFNNSDSYNDYAAGQSYLALTQSEKDMVNLVCSNFDDVTVVYDGANTMELGWVNEHPQIKSVLWVPGTGQVGFDSLGKIMTGEVNPSGKTSDTFAYDLTKAPWYNNFGDFDYDNMGEYSAVDFMSKQPVTPTFVNYNEGIYVGYRYYETAAAEGAIDYASTVQYPFGYGLSYTSFDQKMGALSSDPSGNLSCDVTVTNTGKVSGKSVVEVYYNPPYTNGGIEKSSANLVYFGKTDELAPGASATVKVSFKAEDMASYDTKAADGAGAYVLEAGDYTVSLNSDSHTVLDQRIYTVGSTITYSGDNARSTDETTATNQFSDAAGDVTYLSRADHFANLSTATAAPTNYTMSDAEKALFTCTANYDASKDADSSATMPTTGAKNNVTLADLRGKSYDDAAWDKLLDELSVDDMNNLLSLDGYSTGAVDSVGKSLLVDCDGPAAINNNFTSKGSIAMPCATTIACTWNQKLANDFGTEMGKMASEMGVSGWYAPSMDTHRTAFGGRNFEYYSEDGLLAGKIAAQAVAGAKSQGVYAYIKHFALNEQETNRNNMLCTWANEQSIREIYLKPFEISVKEGGATAVMTAFNYVGPTWAGANESLLVNVLRGEWGFNGTTLTDYFGSAYYMNAEQAVRNGGDACLATINLGTNVVHVTDPTGVQSLRRASHDVLYTAVNSNAYASGTNPTGIKTWQVISIVVDLAIAALLVLLCLKAFKTSKKASANGSTDESSAKPDKK